MIRHMIFWNLADPSMDRSELAAFLKSTFDPMVGAVPGLRCAHIGFDQGMGTHDVGLCCDLDSLEALAAYQDYPPHVAFKGWAKEHFKERCCVDLEVSE